jgi:hypothetical protein
MENSSPIYAETLNGNIVRVRNILAVSRKTSEELAELLGMDIGNVRAILHSRREFVKELFNTREAWTLRRAVNP